MHSKNGVLSASDDNLSGKEEGFLNLDSDIQMIWWEESKDLQVVMSSLSFCTMVTKYF